MRRTVAGWLLLLSDADPANPQTNSRLKCSGSVDHTPRRCWSGEGYEVSLLWQLLAEVGPTVRHTGVQFTRVECVYGPTCKLATTIVDKLAAQLEVTVVHGSCRGCCRCKLQVLCLSPKFEALHTPGCGEGCSARQDDGATPVVEGGRGCLAPSHCQKLLLLLRCPHASLLFRAAL